MSILSDLENFWIRFNNARLDCACLAEEKAALKEENRDLKEKLKVYLTNVTIADGSGGNARENLRPSSMRVERVGHIEFGQSSQTIKNGLLRQKPRPVTCIEGNLCNAIRSRNLISGRYKMPNVYAIVNRN